MDTSPAAVTRLLPDPYLEFTSRVTEAATVMGLALNHPEMNSLARLSAIRHVLDELFPRPDDDPALLPGRIPATADDVAVVLADQLQGHPAAATRLLETAAREQLRVKNRQDETRPPADSERFRLHFRHGEQVYDRTVDLITLSGVTVARARLTVIPAMLPGDIRDGLASDTPFGTLCGDRLARRARAAAAATRRDRPAVTATALLIVQGYAAGISSEEIPWEFCEHVAQLPARP